MKILTLCLFFLCLSPSLCLTTCTLCNMGVNFFYELNKKYGGSFESTLQFICTLAARIAKTDKLDWCKTTGRVVVDMMAQKKAPHEICRAVQFCNSECILYRTWPPIPEKKSTKPELFSEGERDLMNYMSRPELLDTKDFNFLDMAKEVVFGILKIMGINPSFFKNYLPIVDKDGDRFSPTARMRGAGWRGTDCDDSKADIYPGRRTSRYGPEVDHDCNGIFGVDPATKQSYEDKFCANSSAKGIIMIGDSAAAHFSLPPAAFDASKWDKDLLATVFPTLLNEFDWPQCSWSVGTASDAECPDGHGTSLTSFYMRYHSRNPCIHRDFQLIARNGARSTSVDPAAQDILTTMQRDPKNDRPSLVFYMLLGNDVCTATVGEKGFARMTNDTQFRQSVEAALAYVNERVAPGSHIFFFPLADGNMLYDILHNRRHPLGVTYHDLYEFLECEGTDPCWGWMNVNETVRKLTSERARALSSIYPVIVREDAKRYDHLTLHYVDIDWQVARRQFKGDIADIIEPSDGFHPAQPFQNMLAGWVWEGVATACPDCLGPINPHIEEIQKIFGNQGGH